MSCGNFVSTSRREPFQLDALFGPGHLRVATCSWPLAHGPPPVCRVLAVLARARVFFRLTSSPSPPRPCCVGVTVPLSNLTAAVTAVGVGERASGREVGPRGVEGMSL